MFNPQYKVIAEMIFPDQYMHYFWYNVVWRKVRVLEKDV